MNSRPTHPLTDKIRQSPRIDLSRRCDTAWLEKKTIVITGGASGFGAGFTWKWAAHGARVIIGDINVQKGVELVNAVRRETKNPHVHFVFCDVTNWSLQVNLFKTAVQLSEHGGIDIVVANAGIATKDPLQDPGDLTGPDPPPPDFKVIDVNLYGVLYTTHLAFHWLPRNPVSNSCGLKENSDQKRDKHLLLVGSMASLMSVPTQPQYVAAKHGVLGLFRSIRSSAFVHGIRVNLLCPYFIDTPIFSAPVRLLLAGCDLGQVEDVVDAATRFAADPQIVGRALYVGPRINLTTAEGVPLDATVDTIHWKEKQTVCEIFADDWEDSEPICRRIVTMLNVLEQFNGWIGWARSLIRAVFYIGQR